MIHFVLVLFLFPTDVACPDWAPIESHGDRGTFCSSEPVTDATWEVIEPL